ncbi:MAG: SMC-Scp complex subunit ScpB [Oscillospiraceae bacterium]|nr:SMC-Scp complex subunit ScpB [Oscillospiraceae bacterium]
MELSQAMSIVEAVLFAAGDAVSLEKICDILETDEQTAKSVITHIMDEYDYKRRGLKIIQLGENYQMCTRSEYFDHIQKLAEPKRSAVLSPAALEALAVVAYKQPITRGGIERVRGVDCHSLVDKLLERGFIQEVGRLNAPGRPILFGTTDEFLRAFGIPSLAELPDFDTISNFNEPTQLEMVAEIPAEEVAEFETTVEIDEVLANEEE